MMSGTLRVSSYNRPALLDASVNSKIPERAFRHIGWDEEADDAGRPPLKALTRDEARALVAKDPYSVSPWRVIVVQIAVGLVAALLAGLVTGLVEVFWSALYGAGVVVVPGALMARGMTSRPGSVSPGASAVMVMLWSSVKIGVSVVLLMLAAKLVQPLNWPALLATMVLCMLTYWFALLVKRSR